MAKKENGKTGEANAGGGMPRGEYDKLVKAVNAWQMLTGEKIDIGSIPVAETTSEDPAEIAKRAADELKSKAEVTRLAEEARQKERQLQLDRERASGDNETPGTPGNPIVTDRALAQGAGKATEKEKTVGASR